VSRAAFVFFFFLHLSAWTVCGLFAGLLFFLLDWFSFPRISVFSFLFLLPLSLMSSLRTLRPVIGFGLWV
jgi:hypothetical protein